MIGSWELELVETFCLMLKGKMVRREDNDKVIWKEAKKQYVRSNLSMRP